jgi:hypothetical protein
MATLDDALALLRDPAYKAGMGNGAAAPMVLMASTPIHNELLSRGAADEAEARVLASQAIEQLGGVETTRYVTRGLRAGPRREQRVDEYRVPREVFDER